MNEPWILFNRIARKLFMIHSWFIHAHSCYTVGKHYFVCDATRMCMNGSRIIMNAAQNITYCTVLTLAIRHQNSYSFLKSVITPVPPYGSTFKYGNFLRHPNHLRQNLKTHCLLGFWKMSVSRNVKTAEVRNSYLATDEMGIYFLFVYVGRIYLPTA